MMNSPKVNNPGTINNVITTIQSDANWLRKEKKKIIMILAIAGIFVFILSIIFQDIYYAIIRGLIFSIACFFVYYKSDSLISYSIKIYDDGKIIVKKGLLKRAIINPDLENIHLVKKDKNWLIGEKKVKLPVAAFPNLDEKIKAIKF